MLNKFFGLLVNILILGCLTEAYPMFRDRIPNGYNVTNPCRNDSSIWQGVGHRLEQGTGPRNQFGLDFFSNGMQYNRTLCEMDSDEDGRTNGEELGDPDCVWSPGKTPSRTEGITHPGICEPIEDIHCRHVNNWLNCEEFNCSAFNNPDTKRLDLIFPRLQVPAQATTYMCVGFKMPSDKKYQVIGNTVIINNSKFLHHLVLYGCTSPLTDEQLTTPEDCYMSIPACQTLFASWVPGLAGNCYPDDYGFAIGQGGFEYAYLQAHLYNENMASGLYDQPGMTIYYTDHLRPYDALAIFTGQLNLNIPPGQPLVEQIGYCQKNCSNYLGDRHLKIVGVMFHMHLIGVSGRVTHIRNGTELLLVDEPHYDYNRPRFYFFDEYVDFAAGDQLRTICRYDSSFRTNRTIWGLATTDEMCNPVIVFIPFIASFWSCSSYKSAPICPLSDELTYQGCNVPDLQTTFTEVNQSCDYNCSPNCIEAIRKMNNTNCFNVDIGGYIRDFWPRQFPYLISIYKVSDYCSAQAASTLTESSTPAYTGSSQSMGNSLTNQGGSPTINYISSGSSGEQGSEGSPDGSEESAAPSTTTHDSGKSDNKGRTLSAVLASSLVVAAVALLIIALVACCTPRRGPENFKSFSDAS